MTETVNASPTKRLFIKMLTRDLSLEDVILDLVDNSIDSACRHQNADLNAAALMRVRARASSRKPSAAIDIKFDEDTFTIEDSCGGIAVEDAKQTVFRFGKTIEENQGALSVYGIGLKRAVFKLGRVIDVESRTKHEGFRVNIDTDKWMRDDANDAPDWTLPLELTSGASARRPPGTIVRVTKLNPEVKQRFKDDSFDSRLRRVISNTYALFLGHHVSLRINGTEVKAGELPLASSREISTGVDRFTRGAVEVDLLAGITTRPYKSEQAGWYVFCNGRVVVRADRTELTGWGDPFPMFVSKFAGFVGYAFFYSEKPEMLPWTTTKRGLNLESDIYLAAKQRMRTTSRPVLDFLNRMYDTAEVESAQIRELAANMQPAKLDKLLKASTSAFSVRSSARNAPAEISIQYKAKPKEIERVRKALRAPTMSATQIGRTTFEYFLKQECSE